MCIKLCKTLQLTAKDGRVVTLRRPRMDDLNQLLSFINSLVEEDAMILINKKMTLKEEKEWLEGKLRDIGKGSTHMLLAIYKSEVIGNIELKKGMYRRSHVADYSISIKKGYRNIGLAQSMSRIILDIGKKDKSIKVICLTVFPTNEPAQHVYKKLGFMEVARLKKRIFYKGKYIDEIVMDLKK